MPSDRDPPAGSPAPDATQLSSTIYRSLHDLAARELLHHRAQTLQPTALLHEAWLRIAALPPNANRERAQFFALAGKAMRSVLIDHARRRQAQKRDGGRRHEIDEGTPDTADGLPVEDLLTIAEALQELEQHDPELVQVVDLMFFGGRTAAEAAELLSVSSRTVERRWRFARAWLRDAIGGSAAPGA
ncbi:MAG: sigma-70 family RNA polymerase sigma factor [Planctomycetes bacterium]|nr:sigma-70 family RNA polymerase sigma factor [Planctomycetota bacterium]